MSIKKLFNSTENNRKYLSDTTEKDAFSSVESGRNVQSIQKEQEAFVPQVDYSNPAKFARYGSAYLYYDSAINRILDFYPYDGSNADYQDFYNNSLEIEKYIFNNRYPRTNGYIRFSNEGWGNPAAAQRDGYGLSTSLEYISFYGGPGTASFTSADSLRDYFPDKDSQNYKQANIYETDIYSREGLPDDYGSGTRLSNLRSNFDTGVTVEFWLKKEAFTTGSTAKEVVFDMWNTNSSASSDYGRITIELTGASVGSPFRITAQSGTSGIFQQAIGNDLTTSTLEDFKHYAVVFENSGSAFVTKLYVDGKLNDTNYRVGTVNEINSKNLAARIGSLISSPSGSTAEAGWGKMSASLDEFRFWKASRNPQEISQHWFTQVYGGTNSDVSNSTLGVYYKFNEGIVGSASVDSVILDYSGRVTNGAWTGYSAGSRTTDSAIIIASASATEYKDPIIYAEHPDVISLKTELLDAGTEHDANNNTAFSTLMPNWVHEEDDDSKTSDTKLVSHIVGTYLDKLYMQIEAVSTFKSPTYTSASYKPIPFAQHLPQSLGLYMPEIFIEADVLENFTNRDNSSLFEGDLTETKNLIYLNLYNNLSNIYKSKGTEKSIRNVFRCFNVDERLIRLNVYSNNQTYELKNNLKQTLRRKASINFDNENNLDAVVYSARSGSGDNSVNYISGSNALGYENKYGFTLEADVTFPSFDVSEEPYDLHKLWPSASVFGMRSASINPDVGTTLPATDYANFDVYIVQDKLKSKNAYFKLTSSNAPHTFPELTSSIFYNVYDKDRWNLSVRLKPSNYPVTDIVSGSDKYTYDLEFRGVNTLLGTPQDSFLLTASISQTLGQSMLNSAKRVYIGATRTNVTGTVLKSSNAVFSGIRYWGRYIDSADLDQHAADVDNVGISGSYQNISPLDSNNQKYDLINNNLLFLDWSFNKVDSSDSSGNFYVQDMSSGSAALTEHYGWIGNLSNRQHTGYAYGFATSSTDVVKKETENSFKFTDPESPVSSDMIQILSEDDTIFKITENVPSFFYSIEKSMYNAISEEMLDFFAGAVDFNNVIGEPVNRYRERYKTMEKLREAFFRRATKVSDVEKFINYYKWLDDAITTVISQLVPASVEFSEGVLNTVESHVLERNKYQSKFPTIEFAGNDPDTPIMGINEKLYNWRLNHHPVNNQQNTNSPWWVERANRETNSIISMPVPQPAAANTDRELVRKSIANDNNASASLLTTDAKVGYYGSTYVLRKLAKPYKLDMTRRQIFKGGVNFTDTKNTEFTRNALAPAGPVNHEGGVFVPQNVLLGFDDSFVALKDSVDVTEPNKKVKRYLKIQPGREWEDGLGYSNVKSSYAFPFNIISSSLTTGYNAQVSRLTSSIDLVNLHFDAYGPDLEVPMQGPFTNYAVGGLQSRHVPVNTASLDDWKSRPEAWKILLGECSSSTGVTGAIGMVGADYPFPEANEEGMTPYPMTGAQKAVYYRDHTAKRPVNLRNILTKTGSTIIGNYSHNYEVVSSVGAYSNPRGFVDNPPTLPTQITETPSASQGRTFLGIHRVEGFPAHTELIPSYSIGYLRKGHDPSMDGYVAQNPNKSVIRGRFSAPGGISTLGIGYRDLRGAEYSAYNALNYRNLSVRKPGQPPSGNLEASVVGPAYIGGTPGIKSYDIHGQTYGLNALLSRHSGLYGRDSFLVTDPGASYEQSASFIKINRNRKPFLVLDGLGGVVTSSQYDNFWVQHQIPRNDRQYAWVTNSIAAGSDDIRYYGYARTHGVFAGLYSASSGYTAFFNYVTASDVCAPRDRLLGSDDYLQVTNRLNLFTLDPVNNVLSTDISNSLGYSLNENMISYLNTELLQANKVFTQFNKAEDAFNLLMTRRGSSYGWSWNSDRNSQHPVLLSQRRNNIYSIYQSNQIQNYVVQPVSKRGRPVAVNMDIDQENITLWVSHNQDRHFNSVELDNLLIQNQSSYDSTLSQIIDIAASNNTYGLNWILYSETLYPSMKMEFSSSTRPSYDNRMWRTSPEDRVFVGSRQVVTNSYGINVSQSSWPLDAPQGFLTRSAPPIIDSTAFDNLTSEQPAGELQNQYSLVAEATPAALSLGGAGLRPRSLRAAALYARKHCLPSPKSVVSPSCINIPETGSEKNPYADKIDKFAGEAAWEAPTQAGIITRALDGTAQYTNHPSEPWFNNYDDFHYELNLVARDYSVVPEFRISEHVEDYIKFGVMNPKKTDTFEIPGTNINSSTSSFYRDYSNSEFMSSFRIIDSMDDTLTPSEIRLVCSASIRFNPYKGFYPAQRSLDLTTQFSKSFAAGMAANLNNAVTNTDDGNTRPTMAALFAPGILYNSIKSGLAVDYPIVTDPVRIRTASYGVPFDSQPNWMITNNWQANMTETQGYLGGAYFNKRIPFEAIISPDKYLDGTKFFNVEPDPSCSLDVTGTFNTARADSVYTMMASNFFGEVVNFYLKDSKLTEMRSEMVSPNLQFSEGDMFFGRLSIGQTYTGIRSYQFESGASGDNLAYDKFGAKQFTNGNFVSGTVYPIPQYPRLNPEFRRDHTMYSRPSAFGPAVSGQPTGAFGIRHPKVSASSPVDSMYGFNWAYTPPYYDGEAWIDFIFYPTASISYDLERILAETKTVFWRVDAGPSASVAPPTQNALSPHGGMAGTQLIATFSGTLGVPYGDSIYEGKNVNDNAMQLSASLNYFGVERIQKERKDAQGNKENTENEIVGMKWVIQPKWETPILNFADSGAHPITNASDTLTLPQFGSASVPRGMWHQFGVVPADHQGIFLRFGEIPGPWLQYHYDVVQTASAYNNNKLIGSSKIHSKAKPMTDIIKFDNDNSKVKLGSLAEKRTINEAVVAVPYLVNGRNAGEQGDNSPSGQNSMSRKSFFSIPRPRINACLNENIGTRDGDSLEAAGESIRKLVQRMEKYVLPPQFDWLSNSNIEPVVMYMFEFEYSFDKDDLNYMWQNLAPRDYKKMSFDIHSVAHELLDTELMSVDDLRKENLRWMVFKVKQRSQTSYSDLIASTVGQSDKEEKKAITPEQDGYKIQFNWPYDYISFVELVKFDSEVLYKPSIPRPPTRTGGQYQEPNSNNFNQQKNKNKEPYERDVQAPKNVIYGCMDETAANYNPQADAHDPLMCKYEQITGCMDPEASNYNSSATEHDQNHCKYEESHDQTYGCKDPDALNYNPAADIHDEASCTYHVTDGIEMHEEVEAAEVVAAPAEVAEVQAVDVDLTDMYGDIM